MTTVAPDLSDGIAIVGLTGRFPGAGSLEQFWENLRHGVESITFFSDDELRALGVPSEWLAHPRFVKASTIIRDVDQFDAAFFGFNPREAEVIDPQQRLFLECCWEVLEQAGYDPETYAGLIGVYAGIGYNAYAYNVLRSAEAANVGGYQLMIGNDKDFLTTRVSYKLNLKGPSVVVQTACSTSLVAVYQACESLQSYRCDMALAGGVSINVHDIRGYFHQDGMIMSPDGHCRAFDAKARGTVSGKGLGVVVLKRLADAIADGDTIHAVLKGWAINNDGSLKVGYTAPSVEGQAQVIAEALAMSNVPADTITYVEAHGTGTELGDPIEIGALNMVYRGLTDRRHFCAIGSLKTNIGHLDTAAGVAGLIKATLAVEKGELPPSLHYQAPNPQIDFDDSPFFVNTALTPWQTDGAPRRAGVSSFGIGGTNAHVILEQAPPVPQPQPSRPHQLIVVSARSAAALDRASTQLAAYLESNPDVPLGDVAYTLQVGRRGFDHRRALVCRDAADAARLLRDARDKRVVSAVSNRQGAACAFMFSGQGAQRVNMARALYEHDPVFREIVDECAAMLEPSLGVDLRAILYPQPPGDADAAARTLTETRMTQPALFVIEYALARLWMHWGVNPVAMIGHSIGEYVAACLAGVFSLADALALVAARGRLMQAQPAGAMLAVQMSARELQATLDPSLSLAADNAPGLCVVSGEEAAVARLEENLAKRNVFTRRLHTSHAFHSHMMEPVLAPFRAELERITLHPPQIPYVSNVTGTWITADQATNPDYWTAHLRQAVRFTAGVATLLASEVQVLLEVGPGNTLRSLASQQLEQGGTRTVIASLPLLQDGVDDQATTLDALGRLWTLGVAIDWPAFYSAERRRRLPLPTYPFERQRYWVEPKAQESRASAASAALQKRADAGSWFYLPGWKRTLAPQPQDPEPLPAGECWVIFDELKGLGRALAHRLALEGNDVYRVVPGQGFAPIPGNVFSMNLNEPAEYLKLVDELKALGKHPRRIVHIASLLADQAPTFAGRQATGFYSLLRLAQALGQRRVASPVDLTVVSAGLHDVLPADQIIPERCTILGACTVIPQEYATMWCRSIDLGTDPDAPALDALATTVMRELTSDRFETVAYRGDARFVQTFEDAPVPPPRGSRFKTNGVYLITGGLGSLGLTLADHLARTKQARLVLTGRTVPPPREQWAAQLAAPEQNRTTRQILAVQYLEKQGAEVLCVAADASDEAQLREVIAAAEDRFGRIDGVIHAAGIVGGEGFAAIQELTPARCAMQFQPKAGVAALARALTGRQLDVVLVTSSISCELGGLGYAAYAAANHFLSGFAAAQRKTSATPWIALDLDGFRFGTDAGTKTALFDLLMTGAEGVEVIERALALEPLPSRLIVSTASLAGRINQYVTKAPPAPKAKAEEPAAAESAGHARPELATAYEAPADDLEQTLARIWQQLLGIDQVGRRDDFFELGGHSLLAVQVVSRVEQACGVQIALRDIFEARTVAELADRIKTLKWLVPGENPVDDNVEEREEIEI